MVEKSYEVMTLQNDRWNVAEVMNNRDEALKYAQMIEKKPGTRGVRVIQELFDDKTGKSYEQVIYEQVKALASSLNGARRRIA